MFIVVDPPRKRIDTRQLNGQSSRLSLGNISEGSPLSSRRALAIHTLFVDANLPIFPTFFSSEIVYKIFIFFQSSKKQFSVFSISARLTLSLPSCSPSQSDKPHPSAQPESDPSHVAVDEFFRGVALASFNAQAEFPWNASLSSTEQVSWRLCRHGHAGRFTRVSPKHCSLCSLTKQSRHECFMISFTQSW